MAHGRLYPGELFSEDKIPERKQGIAECYEEEVGEDCRYPLVGKHPVDIRECVRKEVHGNDAAAAAEEGD